MMELCFPIFTLALSTPMSTQVSHEMLWDKITEFMLSKIARAVAAFTPDVVHISRNLVSTFLCSSSNIRTVSGFILSKPVLLDPSTASVRPGGRKIGLVRQVGVARSCGHIMEVVFSHHFQHTANVL